MKMVYGKQTAEKCSCKKPRFKDEPCPIHGFNWTDDNEGQETSKRNGVLQVGTSVGLSAHVREHLDLGCREVGWTLGIKEMPEGYALMLDADDMYFYWLRYDGVQSVISWDKWAAYRGARDDAKVGT